MAFAVTAAVGVDGKADRIESAHRSELLMPGMLFALKGEFSGLVQFGFAEVEGWRILHQPAVAVLLIEAAGRHGIVVVVKETEHPGKGLLVGGGALKAWQGEIVRTGRMGDIAEPADFPEITALGQCLRELQDGPFAHAVDEGVGLGVEEDGTADGIGPIVIVGDAAQAGFDAAEDDRPGGFERAPDQVGIDDHGPVGAAVVEPARGKVVALPPLLEGGIVGDHRIDTASADAPEEPGLAEAGDLLRVLDRWLGDDANAEAVMVEPFADLRGAVEGAVDVTVTGDEDDVARLPAQLVHLLPCCG